MFNFKKDPFTRQYVSLGPSMLWTVWKGLAVEARLNGEVWVKNSAQGVTGGIGISWKGEGS